MTPGPITDDEAHEVAIDILKALGCPAKIMEALDLWWMIRSQEVIKLHVWIARSEGQLVDAGTTIRALPSPKEIKP